MPEQDATPRVLMAFRADEVAPGDFMALPFGPAEVISTQRETLPEKGVVIRLQVVLPGGASEDEIRYADVRPAPHEFVCLWEKR